jgi:hypothetical protein
MTICYMIVEVCCLWRKVKGGGEVCGLMANWGYLPRRCVWSQKTGWSSVLRLYLALEVPEHAEDEGY